MQNAIAYYRASTKRQEESGLGLEAQQLAVANFVATNGYSVIEEFVEIKSGAKNKRKALQSALTACKKQKATLLIAKLDRLSRSVAFIATLMESKVDFKVMDNPNAERFTLHILAAMAEKELADIRTRTVVALAAAKARGVELGKFGRCVLSVRNKKRAELFAEQMRPIIFRLRKRGIKTIRAIAEELNKSGIPTYTRANAHWHPNTVHRLIIRIDNMQ